MLRRFFAERLSLVRRTEVRFSASFWAVMAVLVMLLPFKWLASAIIAAGVHECGHILALLILNVDVVCLEFKGFGVRIHTASMPPFKELLVSLAGPIAGISLILLYRQAPVLAICALAQSIFNILPLLPFDGGRVIVSLYRMLFKHNNVSAFQKSLGYVSIASVAILFLRFLWPLLGFSGIAVIIAMYMRNFVNSGLDKNFLRGKLNKKLKRANRYDLSKVPFKGAVSFPGKQRL